MNMKKSSLALIAGMMLVTAVSVSAAGVDPAAVASKAVGQLSQEMRNKLAESMLKNGPAGAIDVCAKDVPIILYRIEQELGVSIKRTSLKVRNPRNAPDPVEKELLESLAASRNAEASLPPGVTPFPNNRQRFFKTITIEQTCLKCHGEPAAMHERVRRKIAETYPGDRATGYKVGDLRGIISVTVK
jgi:hypothetical protein